MGVQFSEHGVVEKLRRRVAALCRRVDVCLTLRVTSPTSVPGGDESNEEPRKGHLNGTSMHIL